MRLHDLLYEEGQAPLTLQTASDIVTEYALNYRNERQLDAAVDYLLANHKQFIYNGPMYRGVVFNLKEMANVKDVRLYLSKLHAYDIQNQKGHEYVSWSQTIEGMNVALGTNYESGMYVQHGMWTSYMILEQEGTALSVEKVLEHVEQPGWIGKSEEEELLAKPNNTLHLYGFVFDKTYKPYELNQMLQTYKEERKQEEQARGVYNQWLAQLDK